jgi:hypothetical protein
MNHLLASGPHLAVIPTIAAFTIRHFKHKQGQDGGDAKLEPKHPAVKFVLGAWNEGEVRLQRGPQARRARHGDLHQRPVGQL